MGFRPLKLSNTPPHFVGKMDSLSCVILFTLGIEKNRADQAVPHSTPIPSLEPDLALFIHGSKHNPQRRQPNRQQTICFSGIEINPIAFAV